MRGALPTGGDVPNAVKAHGTQVEIRDHHRLVVIVESSGQGPEGHVFTGQAEKGNQQRILKRM